MFSLLQEFYRNLQRIIAILLGHLPRLRHLVFFTLHVPSQVLLSQVQSRSKFSYLLTLGTGLDFQPLRRDRFHQIKTGDNPYMGFYSVR
jgi:hypothetical protein